MTVSFLRTMFCHFNYFKICSDILRTPGLDDPMFVIMAL